MQYAHPEYLIEAETLQAKLGDDQLRVFDTAVYLKPRPSGGYDMDSGYQKYLQGHIPGAGFIDLAHGWGSSNETLNFTLPDAEQLARAIGASGIGAEHQVVLYSSGHLMWATRAWWLLHHAGHQNIAILNGNFRAWQRAGLPIEQGEREFPPAQFSGHNNPARFADVNEVEAGMHGATCTINSLSRPLYEGTGDFFYGRRGHIPGSYLLAYDDVLDNEFFLPASKLHDTLESSGMLSADRVVTYCGGGIAATLNAFACALMGQDNAAVYDGSMSEWVQDDKRPLTEGPHP